MTKLLILAKDGTLVRPKSGAVFVQNPADQELIPGVEDAIARHAADGWLLAIASNQGGVAAGHKTLEDAIAEMRYCMELLPQIERCVFCPDSGTTLKIVEQDAKGVAWGNLFAPFRKPHPGMLKALIFMASVLGPPEQLLMVGDRPEDEAAAQAAGIPFMWADRWRGDS